MCLNLRFPNRTILVFNKIWEYSKFGNVKENQKLVDDYSCVNNLHPIPLSAPIT